MKNFKFDIEKVNEFLDSEEVRDAIKESYIDPSFQGWLYRIYYTIDNTINLCGAMSSNSISMESYNGEEIEIGRINAYQEIENVISDDDIEEIINNNDNEELLININDFSGEEFENIQEALNEGCFDWDSFTNKYYNEFYQECYDNILDLYIEQDLESLKSQVERNIEELNDIDQ